MCQSAETVRELFASDPSLYTRIAVISFYPHILYRVRERARASCWDGWGQFDWCKKLCIDLMEILGAASGGLYGKLWRSDN